MTVLHGMLTDVGLCDGAGQRYHEPRMNVCCLVSVSDVRMKGSPEELLRTLPKRKRINAMKMGMSWMSLV